MKSDLGRIALFLCASLAFGATEARAQSSDPCDLFPDNPADITSKPPSACTASYWSRTATKFFGGLHEFGAMITVSKLANATAAGQAMAKIRMSPGYAQVSYGDGGIEKLEKPAMVDMRTPTPSEVAAKSMSGDMRDLTGEIDHGLYSAIFSCGSNMIYINANPSKGLAARQLAIEFDKNLKSQNICNPTAGTVTSPVTVTAPTAPVAPPTTLDDDNRGGSRSFDGQVANDIMTAQERGARYMAVLSRSYDTARGCWVEERAWVGTVKGSNADRVVTVVGPSITVCVKGAILDQATINATEAKLQNSRNQLAKALKSKAEFEAYLNDPKYSQWAKGEIAKIDVYINQYETYISQAQAGLAGSTPPSR